MKILLQSKKADGIETLNEASINKTKELYELCINDDLGLTVAYFTARFNLVAYAFEWVKLLQSEIKGKFQENTKLIEDLFSTKSLTRESCLHLLRAINIYMTILFIHVLLILCETFCGRGKMVFMAACQIWLHVKSMQR